MNNNNKKRKFQSNKRYFTISVYAVLTFTICLMIFKFVNNWAATTARIASITSMLAPFLIAFLIAYFVTPMVKHIDRILFGRVKDERFDKIHKVIALIISYIIIIGFIAMVLTIVIPQVISSISELIMQSSYLYNNIQKNIQTLIQSYPNINFEAVQSFAEKNLPGIFDYFKDYMSSLIPWIYSAGMSIISWAINIVLAFVISCYLLWGKDRLLGSMKRIVYALFDEDHAKKVIRTTRECNRIFSSFIIGKAIDSLIIGILCFILMNILKLPYSPVISLFVGVTNMIPYFGPFIGAVPGILLLLIIDPKQCIIFGIMIFLLQQFDGSILGPKILGSSTGLQSIWVIFAILSGSYVAGVLGMFLGVPVVAVIAHLLNKMVDYLLAKRRMNPDLSSMDDDHLMRMSDEAMEFEYIEDTNSVYTT